MKKKVLAIGGGGFMGVGPTRYLRELEIFLNTTNVAHAFDLLIGSSVGAMITACLACGHNARSVLELFDEHLKGIFGDKRVLGRMGKGALYDDKYVTALLKKTFGDVTMDKTSTALYVVAWDARKRDIKVFGPKDKGIPVWYAVRCSMSASTFFAGIDRRYKDGGFCANVPLVHGISALNKEHGVSLDQIMAVALVTSGKTPECGPIDPNNFVTTELKEVIVPALTAGNSSDQKYIAEAMIGEEDLFFVRPTCKDYELDDIDKADEVDELWALQYYRDHQKIVEFVKS